MALKKRSELRAIDVRKYCDTRKGKDESGKAVDIPFLNWAVCMDLLYENGAEEVYFVPMKAPDGGYVFESNKHTNKDGRVNANYFVEVEIHIDDLVFTQQLPLMNGTSVVFEENMNQLRISNAHARAFVKGVAIRTGLGFSLWTKEDTTDVPADDPSNHNPLMVKRNIEELLTRKVKAGVEYEDILADLGISKKQLEIVLKSLENAAVVLRELKR